ncbi:MAG: hypoxanthine-guanine phosphoribosyltransferase [Ectothiorhodospiraceae bacterium]
MDDVLRSADRLHTEAEVDAALDRMAQDIEVRLGERLPVVLGVMIGALIPLGRLLPKLQFPLEVDYVHATRYERGTEGKELTWLARPQTSLRDRTVLIVDDILDEGHTLAGIIEDCRRAGAREVLTAVLVTKVHERRCEGVWADFQGVEVPDRYVFGAGMDYKGYFRNLGGIYAVAEHQVS